jgi:hypothetical protein
MIGSRSHAERGNASVRRSASRPVPSKQRESGRRAAGRAFPRGAWEREPIINPELGDDGCKPSHSRPSWKS